MRFTSQTLLALTLALGGVFALTGCEKDERACNLGLLSCQTPAKVQSSRWKRWLKADADKTTTSAALAAKHRVLYPGVKVEKVVVYDENHAPAQSPALVAKGKSLFTANACWTCHGMEGKGNGPAGAGLRVKPTNFHDNGYRYGSTAKSVYGILTKGSPNAASGMVAYAHIPPKDRWALAYYVLSLTKKK